MSRLIKISLILGLFVLAFSNFTKAQVIDPRYQSIFIYQFTKYVEWPGEAENENFVIGVMGKGAIVDELLKMASTKTVNGKTIMVNHYNESFDAKNCNMLFVAKPYSDRIEEVVEALANYPILIITESKGGAIKGASVNFILVNNRIKFEINRNSAKKANLKIRSSLLKLAKVIG